MYVVDMHVKYISVDYINRYKFNFYFIYIAIFL